MMCFLLCSASGVAAQNASADARSRADHRGTEQVGSLSGTVQDTQGALIAGAVVTLTSGQLPPRSSSSSDDGRFSFTRIPSGDFDLRITLTGFDPVSLHGTLAAGQALELPPFALQLSTVSFVVNAVLPPDMLAQQEIHAEEHQRLIGIFPNFFVSYNWNTPPLTTRQKFSLATHNAIDPGNIFLAGTTAGVQQADNAYPGYHQGVEGYAKRLGADLANLEVGTYMGGAVLPTLFRQDPRYFYKGTGTLRSRFFYAVSRAVISRGDNGKWQPAYASVLGDLSAGAISNLYYAPSDRQGATLTLENGFLGVAGDALNDVFQEFILKKLTTKMRNASSNTAEKP